MTKFFTADRHFFHANLIHKFKQRQEFPDLDSMNNGMIKANNRVVGKNDEVYDLGDFTMLRKDRITKIGPILDRLNGTHHLILGNHDEGKPFTYVNLGFASVHTSLFVEEFLCVHDPSVATLFVGSGQKILCGHLHTAAQWINDYTLNVGVDWYNYEPLSIDRIREMFEERHKGIRK